MTKTKAFDLAMQALGSKAESIDIQDWLKTHHNIDMKLPNIATYKSIWRKRNRRKPGPKPKPRAATIAPTMKKDEVTLDEIRSLKELIGRMGEPAFRAFVDLLCMK